MTDDLDDLKRAFDASTPQPDAKRRAQNIALAKENFTNLQGSSNRPRPMTEGPRTGLISRGVRIMLNSIGPRAAAGLTATTALTAVCLVSILPVLTNMPEQLPIIEKSDPVVTVQEEGSAMDASARAAPAPVSAPELSLRTAPSASSGPRPVASVRNPAPMPEAAREVFANDATSGVFMTSQTPVSTFSVDVDTASYSYLRASLSRGALPPASAVRIEEMINYFPYDYAAPDDQPFATSLALMQTPWNEGTQLLRIALQGQLPEIAQRPPLNLVLLVDTSGSMNQPDKLPLLKQSMRLMLGQLRPEDEIAIVAYAGSAGEVLAPTPARARSEILAALEQLGAGGSTNGQEGLEQAYTLAEQMRAEGEVSRVLLATDGDFNVGLRGPEALKEYIAGKRDSGTYLSVLGFGRGTVDDATMQALAQNGNGQAAYIDTLPEAQKVLVDQLSGALFTIARDVKLQVEFNPAEVAEYRLIGYETRELRREDFNNDMVDAGDIGPGHQVTALYEITRTGSDARRIDALRYGREVQQSEASGELAYLKLRYKAPGDNSSQMIETPVVAALDADDDLRFAAAIAGFGETLRGSPYLEGWSLREAIDLAAGARGSDLFGYRAEAIQLMRLAQSLRE